MAFDSLYRQSMVDISESRIGEMDGMWRAPPR